MRPKNAKLSLGEALAMRARGEKTLLSSADFVRQEADRYGLSCESIRRARRGETYRHFKGSMASEGGVAKEPLGDPDSEENLAKAAAESAKRVQETLGMMPKGMLRELSVKGPKGPEGSWDD